ncbi:MAG: hypothetical protein HDR88_05970 [Bacteroides sp.]|nr:hypothetical protein [Bacteroides sp.]
MEKAIDYLEDLEVSLSNLAGLCTVLSLMSDHPSQASTETIRDCFRAFVDILDSKAQEIDEVVSEYYKARAGRLDTKP